MDSVDKLTVGDAAVAGECCTRTVRRAIRAGQLRATRAYGRILIERSELDRWIAARQLPESANTGGGLPWGIAAAAISALAGVGS
jgi:excisionase family DNA binding protein